MHQAYWELPENPFRAGEDDRWFFYSKTHEEALVRLLYAAAERPGVMLLLGAPGAGKTMILRMMRKGLEGKKFLLPTVVFPRLEPDFFLREIARQLGLDPAGTTRLDTLRVLSGFFHEGGKARQEMTVVLSVEDAQAIPDPAVFEDLRFLFNFAGGGPRLFIVLAGTPELEARLKAVPSLQSVVGIVSRIEPLDEEETRGYVEHRLATAGGRKDLFEAEALREIHAMSGGNPRRINLICDTALLVGSGDGARVVTAALVRKAAAELP
ncbi:MAG: AAA family ATPase [Planctomycetota bacterium]